MKQLLMRACVLGFALSHVEGKMSLEVPHQVFDPFPNQKIMIEITTDAADVIAGCILAVEITDEFGGSAVFTGVDWDAGTIWEGNNAGGSFQISPNGKKLYGGITTKNFVSANGILANLIFDASSFSYGSFIVNTFTVDELYPGFWVTNPTAVVQEGGIQIDMDPTSGYLVKIPEPATTLLLPLIGLMIRRNR